jgi:hypothetical protein
MPDRQEIREAILDLVDPGSMATNTIVSELGEQYPERDVKLELSEMICNGTLEEHPKIDGVYRVSD